MQRFEYHVVGVVTIDGIDAEVQKRAKEGYRLTEAFQETKGRHRAVLVFERPVPDSHT